MTIEHYVECGVCNGKRSYLNNSDSSHHSMSSDRLQPGNNVPRSGYMIYIIFQGNADLIIYLNSSNISKAL
jgi:hypothetical protein